MAIQTISFDGDDMPQDSFEIADGKEAVRQRLIQRLRTHRGEWLLDATLGVPYLTQVFVRPTVLAPLILAREERRVRDVASVNTVSFEQVDDVTTVGDDRQYRVEFTARTTEGAELTIQENV